MICSVLREPLIPMYIAFPEITLELCLQTFLSISKKIAVLKDHTDSRALQWQGAQRSLLSGVLVRMSSLEVLSPTYQNLRISLRNAGQVQHIPGFAASETLNGALQRRPRLLLLKYSTLPSVLPSSPRPHQSKRLLRPQPTYYPRYVR